MMDLGNPYDVREDGAWPKVVAVAIALLLVLGVEVARASETRRAVGQPLDAIRHDAPTFACGECAYLVRDRTRGCEWWLVEMPTHDAQHPTQWVALPVDGGEG